MGMARLAAVGVREADAGAVRSSTMVFQAPQPAQRPVHCGPSDPHSAQR